MALLDEIKKRLSGGEPTPPATLNAQAGAQKILGAKATGKALGGGALSSNIGEQVAEQQASDQMAQVKEQSAMAGQELGQQQAQTTASLESAKQDLAAKKQDTEKKMATEFQMGENARLSKEDEAMYKLSAQEQMTIAQQTSRYNQTLNNLASERGIATDDIFEQFRQSNAALEDREDAAKLEQLAFTMRLSDNQYIDNITRVAKVRNLEDDLEWKKESTRLRMGDETALLMDQYGFMEAYDKDERAFNEKIMNMDISAALAMSDAMAKDAAKTQIASGVIGLAQAGAGYAASRPTTEAAYSPEDSYSGGLDTEESMDAFNYDSMGSLS